MDDPSKVDEPLIPFGIPLSMSPASMLGFMDHFEGDQSFLQKLKSLSHCSDDRIAYWLNMNVKTYRKHRDQSLPLKADNREQLILLMTLINHGIQVFGAPKDFHTWLETENFFLDHKKPADLLNTNSGVRLIDDRLTGMEYGDNA